MLRATESAGAQEKALLGNGRYLVYYLHLDLGMLPADKKLQKKKKKKKKFIEWSIHSKQ